MFLHPLLSPDEVAVPNGADDSGSHSHLTVPYGAVRLAMKCVLLCSIMGSDLHGGGRCCPRGVHEGPP